MNDMEKYRIAREAADAAKASAARCEEAVDLAKVATALAQSATERALKAKARVEELEAERERIGIALEWPSQEGDTTLLDAVKEAAQFGVLLCESRTRVAVLEEPQVGWIECPNCGLEHDVQLSRGRTNDPVGKGKSDEK